MSLEEKVEILAPAGNFEALIAGVENGADAVYLGGSLFNARHYAANFNDEELKKAVDYCHSKGVKIYVTVNILMFQRELEEAVDYVYFLYSIGVDAIIIQDIGLLYILQKVLPELPLHGSTQMTIYDSFGANFVWTQGIERVVLARELTLEEIKNISKNSPCELEVFVHGALCISYSGQCLFSSMIGGRSGNRGRCAQPCRLPYKLVEIKGKNVIEELEAPGEHLLSTRDLNTIKLIPELIESGAASFKFEGRMKRPEYVATVIKIYREAIDRYYREPNSYHVKPEELTALEQIFNRDFTEAYLKKIPRADFMSYTKPNNRGLFLGRVVNVKNNLAAVKLEEDLRLGDGLEVWVSVGGRKGETVKFIKLNNDYVEKAPKGSLVELELPQGVRKGDRIFKTYDYELMEGAINTYKNIKGEIKINLKIKVDGGLGQKLRAIVSDEYGHEVEVFSDEVCQKAIKHPLTKEVLLKQLGRLGNTKYHLEDITVNLAGNIMLPLSELNKIRREFVSKLNEITIYNKRGNWVDEEKFKERKRNFFKKFKNDKVNRKVNSIDISVKVGDYNSFNSIIDSGVDTIYIPITTFKNKKFTLPQIKSSIEMGKEKGIKVIPFLPKVIHLDMKVKINKMMDEIIKTEPDGIMVGNLGAIQYLYDHFPGTIIYGDYYLNVINWTAAKFLLDQGLVRISLSPELNFKEIEEFPFDVLQMSECIVHGYLPLMVSRHCPVSSILGSCNNKGDLNCKKQLAFKDRKNYLFPIEMDDNCLMYIFNSRVLSLLDNIQRFKTMGLRAIRLEMDRESEVVVKKVVEGYVNVLKYNGEAGNLINELYPEGVTKGHYFRGVE